MADILKIKKYLSKIKELHAQGVTKPDAVLGELLNYYSQPESSHHSNATYFGRITQEAPIEKAALTFNHMSYIQQHLLLPTGQLKIDEQTTLIKLIVNVEAYLRTQEKYNKDGDFHALWVAFFKYYPLLSPDLLSNILILKDAFICADILHKQDKSTYIRQLIQTIQSNGIRFQETYTKLLIHAIQSDSIRFDYELYGLISHINIPKAYINEIIALLLEDIKVGMTDSQTNIGCKNACYIFGQIPIPSERVNEVIRSLKLVLSHRDGSVRTTACSAISNIATHHVLPDELITALIGCLNYNDESVDINACQALKNIPFLSAEHINQLIQISAQILETSSLNFLETSSLNLNSSMDLDFSSDDWTYPKPDDVLIDLLSKINCNMSLDENNQLVEQWLEKFNAEDYQYLKLFSYIKRLPRIAFSDDITEKVISTLLTWISDQNPLAREAACMVFSQIAIPKEQLNRVISSLLGLMATDEIDDSIVAACYALCKLPIPIDQVDDVIWQIFNWILNNYLYNDLIYIAFGEMCRIYHRNDDIIPKLLDGLNGETIHSSAFTLLQHMVIPAKCIPDYFNFLSNLFTVDNYVTLALTALSKQKISEPYNGTIIPGILYKLKDKKDIIHFATCVTSGALNTDNETSQQVVFKLLQMIDDKDGSVSKDSYNILKDIIMSEQTRFNFLRELFKDKGVLFAKGHKIYLKLAIAHIQKLSAEKRMELLATMGDISSSDYAHPLLFESLVHELNKQAFVVNSFLTEKTLPDIAQVVERNIRLGF